MNCELCLVGSERHRIVHEDDCMLLVVNIEPINNGHCMVLPRRHAENLKDLTPEESVSFLQMTNFTQ